MVPTTLQNSFSQTFPDKMNHFPYFFTHNTNKTIVGVQVLHWSGAVL